MARSDGAALILVLVAMGLLAALGLGLVSLTNLEGRVAANVRDASETAYAAEAAACLAVSDLRDVVDWTNVPSGAVTSRFTDTTRRPTTPARLPLDLDAITVDIQAAQGTGWGSDTPVWRLFLWGPFSGTTPGGNPSRAYLAAWVADDPGETDGRPSVDANGILLVHAEAYGEGLSRRVVEATLSRLRGPAAPVPGGEVLGPAPACFVVGCYDGEGRYWPPGLVPTGTVPAAGVVRLLSWREFR